MEKIWLKFTSIAKPFTCFFIKKHQNHNAIHTQKFSNFSKVFEANFHCVPSDEISSTEACRVHQKKFPFAEINTIMAKQNLQKQVQGSLVHLPWKFLRDSNLLPNINVKEGMVPLATWT